MGRNGPGHTVQTSKGPGGEVIQVKSQSSLNVMSQALEGRMTKGNEGYGGASNVVGNVNQGEECARLGQESFDAKGSKREEGNWPGESE